MEKIKIEKRVVKYGEEVLRKITSKVENFDDNLKQIVEDMREVMSDYGGVGLAAPQVNLSKSLAIVDISCGEEEDEFLVLINPEILESKGCEEGIEGCLSLPGIDLKIKRATEIKLRRQNLEGKILEETYEGFKARAIQHEMDHLVGVLIIDKVSPLSRQLAKKKIKKLKQNNEW